MGSKYLTEMASRLKQAGLVVVEYKGWETRARSSGGFEPDRPWCVMWHHTASQTSPQNDADYMCKTSGDKPIANLLIARDGVVWVLAAGATNTNGKGAGLSLPSGRSVPSDSMNTYAVGMEIANNGVGEPYPVSQIDAAFKTSLTVASMVGIRPDDVGTHQHYAPDRKIDPATVQAVQGGWHPQSVTSSGTWSLSDLRAELNRRTTSNPIVPEDDDMRVLVHHGPGGEYGNAWVVTSVGKYWLSTNEAIGLIKNDVGYDPIAVDATWMRANGPVIGPNPVPGHEEGAQWGAYD